MHHPLTRRVASRLATCLAALAAVLGLATSARALDLGPRRLEVTGPLDVRTALKLSQDLIRLNEAAQAPIYLMIVGSGGSAQGVMLVADTVKALESPVVAVVMSPVMGAGAALALAADQLVMFPSADLALTEVEYEGIAKKDPPKADAPPEEPAVAATREFQQKLRADYLKRFWGFIARRSGDAEAALVEAVEKRGGRVLTAQEAASRKVAVELVTKLGVTRKVEDKTEVKATTTRNLVRTAPAPSVP
jgi:membrane-bound ClpP family serine protease